MNNHKTIPGPKGIPVVGSYWDFIEEPLEFLRSTAANFGDISGFSLFGIPCVLLNHPALIGEILVRQAKATCKAKDYQELRGVFGNGLLLAEGDEWQHNRQIMQPEFIKSRIRDFRKTVTECTSRRLDSWHDGTIIDLGAEMSAITADIAARVFFNHDLAENSKRLTESLDQFTTLFSKLFSARLRLPLKFPTPGSRKAWKAVDRISSIVDHILAPVDNQSGKTNVLTRLRQANGLDGQPLSAQQIKDELTTLIIAGHETTALSLAYGCFAASTNRPIWERLRADARQDDNNSQDRDVTYAMEVFMESMRLYPPAWGIGREALEDIQIDGYTIVKGTQIMMCPAVVHHDPRFFKDPEAFLPERWISENRRKLQKHAYFPFGLGPRSCIGMNFALDEGALILSDIAKGF
ncbi:MAG TPA: cytochrome P450, partial [Gammaproteobacteria bacterium]|nr:cytochrome P450 [Gammaproteobacteria bacterium]